MAKDVLLKKSGFGLFPSDGLSDEFMSTISDGEIVKCTVVRPRNLRHHNMFFALLDAVFKAQTYYTTEDDLLEVLKEGIGYAKTIVKPNGAIITKTKSIAFDKMDQTAFNQFFDKAVEFICAEILPRANKIDLEKRVYEILGGPGPDAFNR